MFIDKVPNRGSRPTILLREAHREGKKTFKTTLANLTHWPPERVEALDCFLKGKTIPATADSLTIERSLPHGHVEAVLGTMRRLGIASLLSSRPSRGRELALAMIAQRVLEPCSKLAATRLWHTTTLAGELQVGDPEPNELYAALDWLLERKDAIERKLARRHLDEGSRVLYDVSSSSYTGRTCPLAKYGYNRDGEHVPSIVYGVLTAADGCPVAVDVYPGNTADPTTVPDQVGKIRETFGLSRVVLVGDRGMLTQTRIDALREHPGLGWISALRAPDIRNLVESECLQLSLFDEQNLAEITSDAYPGERLVACYNPLLAADRKRTREELLAATEQKLIQIAAEVARRTKTPLSAAEIGIKVGRCLGRYKMAKHFLITIEDGHFTFVRTTQSIEREALLDGLYVIRTSEPDLSAPDTVRAYKSLGQIEQAFRCLKGIDLRIRPVHHRTEDHVRAHVFLCLLAYYVEWHMRKALGSLLFADDKLDRTRWTRDPVAHAEPSASARMKKHTKLTPEGLPVHSFHTLLRELGTRCKNTGHFGTGKTAVQFEKLTEPSSLQKQAFKLLSIKS
jgi:transposase